MKDKLDQAFRTFPLESTEKADSETKIPRVPLSLIHIYHHRKYPGLYPICPLL